MIRAFLVLLRGNLTLTSPSLAVFPFRVFQLLPPLVDSRILTFLASFLVPLTFHSMTWDLPPLTPPPSWRTT